MTGKGQAHKERADGKEKQFMSRWDGAGAAERTGDTVGYSSWVQVDFIFLVYIS